MVLASMAKYRDARLNGQSPLLHIV
jgi:hypothetical protein